MFRRISAAIAAAAVVLGGLTFAAAPSLATVTGGSLRPSSWALGSSPEAVVTMATTTAGTEPFVIVDWDWSTNGWPANGQTQSVTTGTNSYTCTGTGITFASDVSWGTAAGTVVCTFANAGPNPGTRQVTLTNARTATNANLTVTFPAGSVTAGASSTMVGIWTLPDAVQVRASVTTDSTTPAPTVTIDIDPNGGSCGTSKVTGFYSTWANAPSDCSKPGSIFKGFNTNAGASDASIAPGGNLHLTGDNRIYAIYETLRVSDAPTDVVAVAGKNQVTVSWKAPADPGSGDVSNYLAQATPSGRVCITSAGSPDPLSCTFNLPATNTQYSFKVQALNIAGWGTESAASNAVSPYDVVLLTAERPKAGFFQRLAGWGSTISMSGRAPGLAPGTAVTPQWKAGNGEWVSEGRDGVKVGSDQQISWSKKLKSNLNRDPISVRFAVGDVTSEEYAMRIGSTVGVPAAPRDVKTSFIEARVPAQRRLQVSWQAPTNDGGSPITSYEVSAQLLDNSAPVRCRVNADQPLTCTLPIGALDRRKTYTVKVTAINARGKGQPGSANFRRPA